jgi:hypothetical protein
VEQGDHETLLAREGGLYRRMYALQFRLGEDLLAGQDEEVGVIGKSGDGRARRQLSDLPLVRRLRG